MERCKEHSDLSAKFGRKSMKPVTGNWTSRPHTLPSLLRDHLVLGVCLSFATILLTMILTSSGEVSASGSNMASFDDISRLKTYVDTILQIL